MAKRPSITHVSGDHIAQAAIATVTATNDNEQVVWTNNTGAKVKIIGAGFLPDTALTGAATNNLILQFRNKGTAGTGTTGITAIKTYASGTDIAAFVEDALVLSTTAADLEVDVNETVALNKTENGTGLTLPPGIATLIYQFL